MKGGFGRPFSFRHAADTSSDRDISTPTFLSVDHTTLPAHAHLNLLGWVSLFLFGIYHRLHPSLEGAKSASVQVWAWIVGTIILTIGVALVYAGHTVGDPIAAVGSIVVLLDMLLFGWLVFRGERTKAGIQPAASPAR